MSSEGVVGSLLAVAAGDGDRAIQEARSAAAQSPPSPLARPLLRFLEAGRSDVYTRAGAVERFFDGGGNVPLYQAAHAALAAVHERDRPGTALDIGCGDGRLAAAALRPTLRQLDVIEPSEELLAAARARLEGHGVPVVAHRCTAQEFFDAGSPGRWDVAQSTFALHTLPPPERNRVLQALARAVRRLLVIEFDVPPYADRSVDHARYAIERYEIGIAEYPGDDLVIDGFLMPVLVGQFDPGRPRYTWEQPIDQWVADLREAGFSDVHRRPVSDYWWGHAHLVVASPAT